MSRTVALGDIHGCAVALDAVVAAVDPAPDDRIIPLGDYINRGPDSRGVLDRLIALGRRCRLVPILGNHDQVLLDVLAGRADLGHLLAMGGRATLASYGLAEGPLPSDAIPAEHIAFLKGCRSYFETDTHLFLHASYWPFLPMAEQPDYRLRWESLRNLIPGPHMSGKRVIVGHSSQKSGEVLDLGYLTCIDTYCYGGGWLTALEVATGRVWQADRAGRLRAR